MIVCLIRAGSVFIRSETWKFFLTARDGYTREVVKSYPKKDQGNDSDDLAFQDEALPKMEKRKQCKRHSKFAKNININKIVEKKLVGKRKAKVVNDSKDIFSEMGNVSVLESTKATDFLTENKLVTTKPWFSKSESEKSASDSCGMNLEFVFSMPSDIRPSKNSSTHSSTNIYDTTAIVNASYALQKTLSVSDSVSGRSMRPRIAEDKNSK